MKVLEDLVELDGPSQLMSEVHSALVIAETYGNDRATADAMKEQVEFIEEMIEANSEEEEPEEDADNV